MTSSPLQPPASSLKPQASSLKPQASGLKPQASGLKPQASGRAFTLVEMLVAMALTLILVYAIAHFYAIIGDSVKDGRGMIEMNQQLRAVTQRLKLDFDQLTVPATTWLDEGAAGGYLWIKEGIASDSDVNGNDRLDADDDVVNGIDANGINGPDWEEPNVSNLLGDLDDVIGMTIRAGQIPFSGLRPQVFPIPGVASVATQDGIVVGSTPTVPTLTKTANPPRTVSITSQYAEVVWWTSFSDSNKNGSWGLDEPRFIHRRQLLIRPDLNVVHAGDPIVGSRPYFCRIPVPSPLSNPQAIWIYDLQQYCDISIRPVGVNSGYLYFMANSLADLAKRQNRFMHVSSFFDASPGAGFPYALDLDPNQAGNMNPDLVPDNPISIGTTQPRHAAVNANSHYRWALFDGGRKGEDVLLSNVLAFDIRVFDPEAVVRSAVTDLATPVNTQPLNAVQFSADPIQPGDPGYAYANTFNTGPFPIVGTGAYVDLGYGIRLANMLFRLRAPHNVAAGAPSLTRLFGTTSAPGTLGLSRFAGFPSVPPTYSAALTSTYRGIIGFTWDSWTFAYERDGVNQDAAAEVTTIIDQATNGLDDDSQRGVDDTGERETTPPYSTPLRGIQIRIRLYEPGTRQVRQATVASDFLNE